MVNDDILIPLALDRYRNLTPPDEAAEGDIYYCPNCGEEVFPRRGPQRRHHFAHTPNNPRTRDCELRIESWGRELLEEHRAPELERTIRLHSMRLGVRRHPYLAELELVGVLPVATPAEWDAWRLAPPSFHSIGALGEVTESTFRPSLGVAEILLDPRATEFQLDIHGAPAPTGGVWKASWPVGGAVFVGTPYRAEARDNLGRVRNGDVLYVPDSAAIALMAGETLRLGEVVYRAIEITQETVVQLNERIGPVAIDTKGYDVRVVLPPLQDPNDLVSIRTTPTLDVLLFIVPMRGSTDQRIGSTVDVVELPSTLHEVRELTAAGPGDRREWTFSVAAGALRRFDVHWSIRHASVQAFGDPDAFVPKLPAIPAVGLTVIGRDRLFLPASFDERPRFRVIRGKDSGTPRAGWEVAVPEGLRVTLDYEFPDETGRIIRARRTAIEATHLPQVLDGALRMGARELTVRFGLFGTVDLECKDTAPFDLPQERLRERVMELGLPPKVRWNYVRAVFSIPLRSPHNEFPTGLKKRLRQVVAEIRRSGGCDKVWTEPN